MESLTGMIDRAATLGLRVWIQANARRKNHQTGAHRWSESDQGPRGVRLGEAHQQG